MKSWDGVITSDVSLNVSRLSGSKPLIMAGPCMFESWEVGAQTCEFMQSLCLKYGFSYIFKSSYDKANRTSSGTARGPGLQNGLELLHKISSTFKVPTLTDVHSADQATAAAKIVDVLQIPAFLCEQKDLLDAAAQSQKTIQIKKGQHRSAAEMIRVANYLEAQGNNKIILCERGSSFGHNNLVVDFRNLVAMGQEGHAVCFDGTHAVQLPGAGEGVSSGLRNMVQPLVRAAVAIGVQAVFLEVHPNPTLALSDAATQLNFEMADEILADIARIVSRSH
jgi:2-dehydro-3-deoxyphosphooctonate aldolase (KDO 8-P synthase)